MTMKPMTHEEKRTYRLYAQSRSIGFAVDNNSFVSKDFIGINIVYENLQRSFLVIY